MNAKRPDSASGDLNPEDASQLTEIRSSATVEFMDRDRPPANLVGFGIGVKWTGGRPTGKPALIALVTQKVAPDSLASADVLPREHKGTPVDVLAVGELFAGVVAAPPAEVEAPPQEGRVLAPAPFGGGGMPTLNRRLRPAQGGLSVGHKNITAGTICTGVYDILPGGSANPPQPGVGVPPTCYILSNNHVLANSNAGSPGDAVLQPGRYDGGTLPADQIGVLARFVPIEFEPTIPRARHRNLVDCAVASANLQDIDREIYWIGEVKGWRPASRVQVGALLQKTGRTTGWTTGRITAVAATVDVGYGGGRVARFHDQIVTTPMSAPGDSGSLMLTNDNVAVGLLFAGSPLATVCNQIENVRSLLRVEVAQRIM